MSIVRGMFSRPVVRAARRHLPDDVARLALVALLGAVPLLAAGCSAPTEQATPAKEGVGGLRSDLSPLTDRFDALGEPVAATWASGTLGDERAPGPSTYWVDAVVELEPAQAAALVAQYAPAPTEDRPRVVADLDASLPAGDLLGGDALDAAFTQDSFTADAYLDAAAGVLVLVAVGQ